MSDAAGWVLVGVNDIDAREVRVNAGGDLSKVFKMREGVIRVMRRFQRQGERSSGVGRFVEAAAATEIIVTRPRSLFTVGIECTAA